MTVQRTRDEASSTTLQTLDRGLSVLEWVAGQNERPSIKEVSAALGLNITTAYHLVNTLISRDYLSKGPDGRLALGLAISTLWGHYSRVVDRFPILTTIATELMTATGDTAFLSIWHDQESVLVFSAEGSQHLRVSGANVGLNQMTHARASGKAMLAFLPAEELEEWVRTHELIARTPFTVTDPDRFLEDCRETARTGLAFDIEGFVVGVASVSAPVFDGSGTVIASLTISTPIARWEESRERAAQLVLEAGSRASREIGYAGEYPPSRGL